MFPEGRVRNLASIIRYGLKLLRLLAGALASSTSTKLTAQQRAALEALQLAIEALLVLLPAPGTDDSPETSA